MRLGVNGCRPPWFRVSMGGRFSPAVSLVCCRAMAGKARGPQAQAVRERTGLRPAVDVARDARGWRVLRVPSPPLLFAPARLGSPPAEGSQAARVRKVAETRVTVCGALSGCAMPCIHGCLAGPESTSSERRGRVAVSSPVRAPRA